MKNYENWRPLKYITAKYGNKNSTDYLYLCNAQNIPAIIISCHTLRNSFDCHTCQKIWRPSEKDINKYKDKIRGQSLNLFLSEEDN